MQEQPEILSPVDEFAEELQDPALGELVDQLARFFDRFGFRRNLGRLWAALYLAPSPLTQADLGALLELSTGLVSSGLKELEHWGAVRVVTVRGSRATHYEAEERLLRIVSSILTKRELPSVRKLREAVREVKLGYVPPRGDDHFARRLRAIETLCELYDALTGLITRIARLPESAIQNTMRVVTAARFLTDTSTRSRDERPNERIVS